MGQCKDCVRFNTETNWCAEHKTKKLATDGCRDFVEQDKPKRKPRDAPNIAVCDMMVDFMRRRGVSSMRYENIVISLGSPEEPPPPPPKPPKHREPPSAEDIAKRARSERKQTWFGTDRTAEE
jgi:hypothetical protein